MKAGKIENTGDTKGHEGPRYRQETIDANRPAQQIRVGRVEEEDDDGGMEGGRRRREGVSRCRVR